MDPDKFSTAVREKLALLEHHRSEVGRLNQLLEISKQEVERLETELEYYRTIMPPIGKCPTEILVEIFKVYIEGNPRLIRRLLLVCRHWYKLVISVPELWTYIPITVDSMKVQAQKAAKSIRPRILACIKRSQDQLLYIDLDLSKLLGPMSYLTHKGDELVRDLGVPVNYFKDVRRNWLSCDGNLEHLPWNSWHIYQLLDILRGSNQEMMRRWASLSVSFPDEYCTDDVNYILEKLKGATHNLRSLSLRITKRDEINPPNHIVFSNLSSLRQLFLGHCALLPVLDLSSSPKLEHCEFVNPDLYNTLNLASDHFRSVQKLILRWDRQYRPQRNTSSAMVSMPMLHTLEFRGQVQGMEEVQYNLPSLNNLFIERTSTFLFTEPPDVQPISVTWRLDISGGLTPWPRTEKQDALEVLLRRYGMIESIKVDESAEQDLLFVLADLEAEGYSLPLLKEIGIIGDWDTDTVLRVHMIE